MPKYLLTSDKFEGWITYGYAECGLLNLFEISAQLSEAQHAAVLKALRHGLDQPTFLAWAAERGYKLAEMFDDLSWDTWWTLYNMKRNKDRAQPLFNQYDKAELQKVFRGTKAYNRYCARHASWYNKMLPDTFLKGRHYNDEWDKI